MRRNNAAGIFWTTLFYMLALKFSFYTSALGQEQAQLFIQLENEIVEIFKDSNHSKIKSWKNQLFYKNSWLGEKSLVTSPGFFISKNGSMDPLNELLLFSKATLTTEGTTSSEKHPQCRFPARFSWVLKNIPSAAKIPRVTCPLVETLLNRYPIERISFAYASQFLANPASFFGHNFLILKQKHPGKTNSDASMLDMTLSYSAMAITDSVFLYAIKGVFGGFSGYFSLIPYYMKVQEYNNFERRDIWEYELDFNETEIRTLLLLLFEVGSLPISYYYFDTNCSSILIKLLAASSERFQVSIDDDLWVSPLAILRRVYDHQHTRTIGYKPSIYSQLMFRYEQLNLEDQSLVKSLVEAKSFSQLGFPQDKNRKVMILDTVSDFIDYDEHLAGSKLSSVYKQLRSDTLVARSEINDLESLKLPTPIRAPHMAHDESLLALAFNSSTGGGDSLKYPSLRLRGALHGLGENDLGLAQDSELRVLDMELGFDQDTNSSFFQRFDLLALKSVSPFRGIINPLSWELSLGTRNKLGEMFYDRRQIQDSYARFGAGISGHLPIVDALFYSMLNMEPGWIFHGYGQAYVIASGNVGGFYKPNPYMSLKLERSWSLLTQGKNDRDFFQEFDADVFVFPNRVGLFGFQVKLASAMQQKKFSLFWGLYF